MNSPIARVASAISNFYKRRSYGLKSGRAMIVLATSSIASCATPPNSQEIASADYGTYPSEYAAIVSSFMYTKLKDSESAQYRFLFEPKKAWTAVGGRAYGYAVCALINAKNSFGAYTGAHLYYFLIHDGHIVSTWGGDGSFDQSMAEAACSSLTESSG